MRPRPKGKPFPKGQSGNPRGYGGKGTSIAEITRELLELKDIRTAKGELVTRKRAIVERLFNMAINEGNPYAIKMILDKEETQGQKLDAEKVLLYIRMAIIRATSKHPDARLVFIEALENLNLDVLEQTHVVQVP